MAKSKKKSSPKSLRNTLAWLLVLLLVFGVNYFMGDPLGLLEGAPAEASPAAAAPGETSPGETSPGVAAVSGEGVLDVYVLDVGQGDSIFLRSPSGKTMLVDAGEKRNDVFEHIDAFLQEQGVSKLDVVIGTHPHSDHIGSMQKVIETYEVGTYYMPDAVNTTKMFENLIDALQAREITVKQAVAGKDALIPWDEGVEVRILSPFEGYDYSDLNDSSVICRVKYGETAVLLTGDAEAYAEKIALQELPAEYFRADVLKLGHHGSSSSTCASFLTAVSPSIAVASLGEDNDYGHPHREIVAALKEAGIPMYRTDESGDVHILLDGSRVSIQTQK